MMFSRALPVLSFVVVASAFAAEPPANKGPASNELVLTKWSGALNVPDPVACAVDPQGRVYVTATTRRKVADLDIREHTMWIPNDVGFSSIEEKSAFYHDVLAPGKLRQPRGMLKDQNGDGSIDWKDLTVQSERIYQLRDTDGDGIADKMTTFAEGFNTEVTGIAAGVLYHDGWVYATIAPDLWRFKDTDDDGVADIREIVVHGFGFHIAYAGHDMHGLSVGPDGRIYWSIGDKGTNVTSREGRHFFYPNEGAILRIEPDGSGFEVYAHGVRNPQEPAFNDLGDLIAVDNDADMKGERERFIYIPESSDSGWRCNYQYMKEESPWMREGLWKPHFAGQPSYLLPPILSYSDGPAGFRHDPGTALGDKQRGLFLLNEFPSGKMRAFHAEPDGASYRMADARVVNEGIMGIGMSWHPDGSLMMVDWIGGYPLDGLGALWRVDSPDGAKNPLRIETHELIKAGFGQRPDNELVTLLSHRDQRVRQGAQMELAKRGNKAALLTVANDPKASLLARIHGLWGYGQLLRRNAAGPAELWTLLADRDPEIRAQTAKVLGDATATKPEAKRLIPLLADSAPRVRLQAAIALGKLAEPSAVDPLFAMAAKDSGTSVVLRHAAVTGLAGCATPAQLTAKTGDTSIDVRLASVVALRRQRSPAVARFLQDRDPLVVQEAALAIHDERGIDEALPALAALLPASPQPDTVTRRAINANLRLGTTEAGARLLAFALDSSPAREAREEALSALVAWSEPPPLDLVDGFAHKLKPVRIDGVLTPRLGELLALSDPGLKTLAIKLLIAHELKAAPAQIASIVADAKAPGELRAQSLRLMGGASSNSDAYRQALDSALAPASPAALHRAALELLAANDPVRLVTESKVVLQQRSAPEQQHAIALLAKAGTPAADAVLAPLAESLAAGSCAPALQLDVLEALKLRGPANPSLDAKLSVYSASPAATSQRELLAGGDLLLGREVLLNHLNANCLACHSIEAGAGSEVGPNLRTIGAQHDSAYLLESLLVPSAKIATGFGLVNVTLKDGTEVTGTLARETKTNVSVRLFDGVTKSLARTDIASQTPPVSIMPPMGAILQPRELRDVIAFLSSLKGKKSPATPPADG